MLKNPKLLLGTLGVLTLALPATGQEAQTVKEAAGEIREAAAEDVVEPASIEALQAMSQHLAKQTAFGLKTEFAVDLVLDNGQTVEVGGTADYLARRPDRLKVDIATDLGDREFLFDGKSLFIVSPERAVYGQLDEVGPTIKEMLEAVSFHANFELPLADLFDAGTADALEHQVTEGFLVGAATVDGQPARHWAYRTAEKDFQVWIADGDSPVPLKLMIEDRTQESRPRFETTLAWSPEPKLADADFTFTPPADATQIHVLLNPEPEETQNAN